MLLGAGFIWGKRDIFCLGHGVSSGFLCKKQEQNQAAECGMMIEILTTICFSLKNSLRLSGVFGKQGRSSCGRPGPWDGQWEVWRR
jgi:hypothetical protein